MPWLLEQLVQLPSRIITLLGNVLPGLINTGVDIIGFLLNGLVKAIPKIMAFIITLPIDMMTALRRGLFEQGPRALEWFKDLPGNIISAVSTALDWLWDTGWAIIRGLIRGTRRQHPAAHRLLQEAPRPAHQHPEQRWRLAGQDRSVRTARALRRDAGNLGLGQ